jgi:transposase InsO family protein
MGGPQRRQRVPPVQQPCESHAKVPVEEKLFRIIQVADAATQPAETLGLLSKSQLQDHLIDQYWKTEFVDRKVREALRALFGAEPDPSVIRLVHGRVPALSRADIRASLGRVRATFGFPVVTVPAMRPPAARQLRRDVVDPTRASTDKAVCDGTPWRRVTLRSALRDWETIYNTVRPHQALGYRTPAAYLASVGVEV